MDETDEDEYWQLQQGLWGSRVQESMRGRQKVRTNPSQEDRKVRRRQRRATAGGDVEKRAELVRALNKASSMTEQARLLDELAKFDNGIRAKAAQDRELDFADTVVRSTLAPASTFQHHTAATDWLGDASEADPQWQNRVVAEAAMWFNRVPDFVKQDADEFGIQAQGKARQVAGQYGIQAQAAQKTFVDYVGFLRTQAASGLDQIQQTVDPHDNPKTTPLNPEVFDNFAPEVHPINEGVTGTETSERNPLLQEIVNGGSGADAGAPEKPGGHSTDDELSWNPPEGVQQDSTAPLAWGTDPEGGAGNGSRHMTSSRYDGRSPAIGYTMNMDEFRAQASRQAGGQGKAAGAGNSSTAAVWPFNRRQQPEQAPAAPAAPAPAADRPSRAKMFDDYMLSEDAQDAFDRAESHRKNGCPPGCPGGLWHGKEDVINRAYGDPKGDGQVPLSPSGQAAADHARRHEGSRREAASGLDQIQQTVDPHDNPKPTGLPPEVAFPLDDEFQEEWTTNGTGNAQPGKAAKTRKRANHSCTDCGGKMSSGKCQGCGKDCSCAECKKSGKTSSRKQADMFGASDDPHAVPQQDVANTPDTTVPPAANGGGQAAGRADANANEAPTFGDNSSFVPEGAQGYAQGYSSVDQSAGLPTNEPPSMAGPGQGVTRAGSKVSSLIVTAAERENADFKKGYGYGSNWKPGTRLVSTGSKEFEAGVYAGVSDNPRHQREFVAAHRAVKEKFPKVAARADQHVRVTHRVARKNEHPSNGLYLVAGTSMDLDIYAPGVTPDPDGSTPLEGEGHPGPLDGQQDAAAPGGPAPYNGAPPYGSPVVPNAAQSPASPADALIGGGHMSTPNQVMAKQSLAFRRRVQSALLAERQGK